MTSVWPWLIMSWSLMNPTPPCTCSGLRLTSSLEMWAPLALCTSPLSLLSFLPSPVLPSPFSASSLLLDFPFPPPHTPTDHPGILWCVQCSTDWSSAQRRFRNKEKTPERCSGLQKSGQNVNVTHTQTLLHTFSPHPPPTGSTPQFSWEEDGGTKEDHSCHWNRPSCPRVPYVQVNSISSFYHCKRRLVDALSMYNIYTLTSQLEYSRIFS